MSLIGTTVNTAATVSLAALFAIADPVGASWHDASSENADSGSQEPRQLTYERTRNAD